MTHKIANNSKLLETLKLLLSVSLLVGSLLAYYHYSGENVVVRVLGVIGGFALATYIFYLSDKGKQTFQYLSLAKKEVMQVVWPTRQETVQMTLLVFVAVIVMGIFMWLVDMFFLWGVKLLTGQGG